MDALFARYFDGDLNDREAREFLEAIAADPRLEKELREYERVLALGKTLPVPKAPAGFTESVMAQIAAEKKREIATAERRKGAVTDADRLGAAVSSRGRDAGQMGRDQLTPGGGPERTPFRIPVFGARWAGVAVAAAAVALAYVGGLWTAGNRNITPNASQETGVPAGTATTATTSTTPTSGTATTGTTGRETQGTTVAEISPAFVNQAAAESGLRYVRLAYVPTDPTVEKVTVVGSFNNWDPDATPLRHQDGVWSTILVLAPGNYEYMFFENGARWVTDPLAAQKRDDGFGGANAVLDVGA